MAKPWMTDEERADDEGEALRIMREVVEGLVERGEVDVEEAARLGLRAHFETTGFSLFVQTGPTTPRTSWAPPGSLTHSIIPLVRIEPGAEIQEDLDAQARLVEVVAEALEQTDRFKRGSSRMAESQGMIVRDPRLQWPRPERGEQGDAEHDP